jgi:hypothetical protein
VSVVGSPRIERILSTEMLDAYAQHSVLWEYGKDLLWAFLYLTLVATWFFVKRLPDWFRSIRSASWPMVEGKIEALTVTTFAEQSLAQLAYSYLVDGERYSGYFTRQFADEQDAWDYVRPLKGQPIFVRHKPSNPAVPSVRIADQNSLLASSGQGSFVVRFLSRSVWHIIGASSWNFWAMLGTRDWPLSKGRIEFGTVTQKRESNLWYFVPYYVCEIGYSYAVGGEYYSGCLERTFFREGTAQKFTEELKGKDIFVRYRPDSPAISALRGRDQQGVRLA